MFYYSSGNLNHEDHRFVECGVAVHLNHYMNSLGQPPFFTDLVLVGNINSTATTAAPNVGPHAVHSPKDNEYWFVSGLHVSNYHNVPVLFGCIQTGCTMRYERARWARSNVRVRYSASNQGSLPGIYHDFDGSLTGLGFNNSWVVWSHGFNTGWADGVCSQAVARFGGGSACGLADGKVRMRRLWVRGAQPWQLDGKQIRVISAGGSDVVQFDFFKLYGWAIPVVANRRCARGPTAGRLLRSYSIHRSHPLPLDSSSSAAALN